MRHIHFIGIGGVGMNGLAQLAALSGYRVSGSDRSYDPSALLFQCLEGLGIKIHPQDGNGISQQTNLVVYSTAIEPDNPDILKAKALNIPLLHRSGFLKELVGDAELIAVAGTAGKTTTTGLLGWIFECMGKDPSVYNGAAVLNWRTGNTLGNIRKGSSNLWIIEADESDKSFLNFNPTHSIITNISKDHYGLDELHAMFNQFESQTTGTTIRGQSSDLSVYLNPRTDPYVEAVPLLGKHNLENARCAARLCAELGMDMDRVLAAVHSFRGIERRLEIAGAANGVTVIDDYAHNPAKIAAALSAVAEKFGTVHAYWRPHGFTPLHQNLAELADVFVGDWEQHGGSVSILPVYYAGGTVARRSTSSDLAGILESAGIENALVPDYPSLQRKLEKLCQPGDAILGMGARDPELPRFAQRLVAEWKIS